MWVSCVLSYLKPDLEITPRDYGFVVFYSYFNPVVYLSTTLTDLRKSQFSLDIFQIDLNLWGLCLVEQHLKS